MAASLEINLGESLAADEQAVIFATRPLSAGVNFQARGAYKLITQLTSGSDDPYDMTDEYIAIFGAAPITGQKVLLMVKRINSDGLASDFTTVSAIAS